MDRHPIEFSTKNIPIPPDHVYTETLLRRTLEFIARLRWRVWSTKNKNKNKNKKNTDRSNDASQEIPTNTKFGLKSYRSPPSDPGLLDFERDLLQLVRRLKFSNTANSFQGKLSNRIEFIKKSPKLFVLSDKTGNMFSIPVHLYNEFIRGQLNANYKKAKNRDLDNINDICMNIANNLNVLDRTQPYTPKQPHFLFKDHKPDFDSKPTIRLISPTKSDIGSISKFIIDGIIPVVRDNISLSLWRSTGDVIAWFSDIADKPSYKFIQFDYVDYYGSISPSLLNKAISFARSFVDIPSADVEVILAARKTLISFDNCTWKRAGTDDLFDITMGSSDSAQITDLVGLFLLAQIKDKFPNVAGGQYRDDGLIVIKNCPGPKYNKIKKELKAFIENAFELDITFDVNNKVVNFLDVTLDLSTGLYRPYRKPNKRIQYINVSSCHPKGIIDKIIKGISIRISNLSANEEIFNESAFIYNDALSLSGFKDEIYYVPYTRLKCKIQGIPYKDQVGVRGGSVLNQRNNYFFSRKPNHQIRPARPKDTHIDLNKSRSRIRQVTWFNPPFSIRVKNIPKLFFGLISKHFPKGHKYYPLCNRSTLKLSYSVMPSFASIISMSNKAKLREYTNSDIGKDRSHGPPKSRIDRTPNNIVNGPILRNCTAKRIDPICNCRDPQYCPLGGCCRVSNVVYKCCVHAAGKRDKSYVGSSLDFKSRFRAHINSFSNSKHMADTTLAVYVSELKNSNTDYNLKWSILDRLPNFKPEIGTCKLCIRESLHILRSLGRDTLNKITDVFPYCRHRYLSTFLKRYKKSNVIK